MEAPQAFRVIPKDRVPFVRFMCEALEAGGCRVLRASRPDTAPFRISFESPDGVRMGIPEASRSESNKSRPSPGAPASS